MTTIEKRRVLRELNMGDVVCCVNGQEYEFVRLKQTKFIGKRMGVAYDIPLEMFAEVASRSEKVAFDVHSLKEGDLFYITNSKQEATIFRFKYMISPTKVMAENPITNTGVRISPTMIIGSVIDLSREGR
jgi:hypothetical protein